MTKVNLSGAGNVGESNGGRYAFSQVCEHGACDAAMRVFGFDDGSIVERTMKYADGAYVYPPQTTTASGVTCTVGNKTLTEFQGSFSGALRPSGIAADGKGAAELTGTRSFTAVPFGAAAAAGCDIAGWTGSVHLVRTAAVPFPVLRETSPELDVLQVFSNVPYPAVPSVNVAVEVKNISNAPVRMGRSSFVVHSAVDGTPLPKRFQPTEPEILLADPLVLEPGEIGYLSGSNGGFVPTASGGPAIRPWEIGYLSMKIAVNDPNVVFPILRFAAKNVIWRARAGQTLGAANAQIEVAGTLVNTSGTSAGAPITITVFLFDGGGALIGWVSGYLGPADAPWEARPFVAQGGGGYPPPELQSRIATAKVIAWSVRP